MPHAFQHTIYAPCVPACDFPTPYYTKRLHLQTSDLRLLHRNKFKGRKYQSSGYLSETETWDKNKTLAKPIQTNKKTVGQYNLANNPLPCSKLNPQKQRAAAVNIAANAAASAAVNAGANAAANALASAIANCQRSIAIANAKTLLQTLLQTLLPTLLQTQLQTLLHSLLQALLQTL